jgi:glycosyltransferase involved in cell wall biosynthesis
MNSSKSSIGVFILAKNEQANIGRCLENLRPTRWDVVVLDSGSTDNTKSIVEQFHFAKFKDYCYVDHCKAYNDITTELALEYKYAVILDADMVVTEALQMEIAALTKSDATLAVIDSEILMCADGLPLKHGSLCPPKSWVFATGTSYFINSGHAEKLKPGIEVTRSKAKLGHDDRKSYASYLQSQLRYSKNLVVRTAANQMSFRDWVRTKTPVLIFAVPFVSYFLKRGFMSGRAGGLYALDRLIAEAIMYRQALSKKLGDM